MWILISLLVACGDPAPETPAATEPAPAPAASTAAPMSHGDHMADMAATREKLRTELGAAYDAPVAGLDQADAAAGKALYEQYCVSCHGAAGKGDGPAGAGLNPPPGDLTDSFHARYYSDAARVHIIRNGIPGTAMAGVGSQLNDQQVLDLYAYIRPMRGVAGGEAAPAEEHDHSTHQH